MSKKVVMIIPQRNLELMETEFKEFADHPDIQIEIVTDEEFDSVLVELEVEKNVE